MSNKQPDTISFLNKEKKNNLPKNEQKYSLIYTLLNIKKTKEAINKIYELIMKNNIFKTLRSDSVEEMWYYKDGIYIPNGITYIKEIISDILKDYFSKTIVNKIVNRIEAETYIEADVFFNKQNEYPYILPVKNGLLNLKTLELKEFTPDIYFFNKINASYKPEADCPNIKHFIKEIINDDVNYKTIQEMIGFSLIKKYKYEKSFMLYGSHGRNGKSKLLELIKIFLNPDNISAITLDDMENNDFSIGNLQNKLVNIAGDISNEAINHTEIFKSLTGGDLISANRKFKERINFKNYAKLIFACNELPPVYTNSKAFWLRWIIIDFPYQFLTQKEINSLTKEEQKYVRLQNTSILDNLTTEDELNGLLNFAIEGLHRIEQKKDFSTDAIASDVTKIWKRNSNSVSAFIDDNIVDDYDSFIIKKDFVKKYQEYCKEHKIKIMSDKVIRITLKEQLGISDSRPIDNGIQVHAWDGIRFKNDTKKENIIDYNDGFSHSL
jgi:putative DNA primase/helicase